MDEKTLKELTQTLQRIAASLETISDAVVLAPKPVRAGQGEELVTASANHQRFAGNPSGVFRWSATESSFNAEASGALPLGYLRGVDWQMEALLRNTQQFAHGLPANNVLLWGAKGTGKSSLVTAVHKTVLRELGGEHHPSPLCLLHIPRESIGILPHIIDITKETDTKFIFFCDDFFFAEGDDYGLKTILEGGHALANSNILFYATSNMRHLQPRTMAENIDAIHSRDVLDQHLALADRFGLSLGFHSIDKPTWLSMINGYMSAARPAASPALMCDDHCLKDRMADADYARGAAYEELPWYNDGLQWCASRGFSGRGAWQFARGWCGAHGFALAL